MDARGDIDVLLCEDDDELAAVLEFMLADEGCHVVRARDGRQALDLLERMRPGVLLLDMVMPRLDGFGVLAALRGRSDPPPVIGMSSFEEFLPEAARLGAVATLAKPFTPEELNKALAKAPGARPQPVPERARAAAALPGIDEHAAEDERIERLHCLRIMQAEPDAALEELVRATAELMRTPMALVSIITEDRQWWKAMHGVTGQLAAERGTVRGLSFCTHAVAARAPLVVGDAHAHPVFKDNELVLRGVLRAYAGVPVEVAGVGALGTLCVLDPNPHMFTCEDLQLLGLLARRCAAEIEWREQQRLGARPAGAFQYLSLMDEVHGIYNAQSFAELADVVARRTLLVDGSFAVVAVEPVPRGAWPQPEDEHQTRLLVQALRAHVRQGDLLGRVGDRAVAALLPGAGQKRLDEFVAAVLAREEQLRRERLPNDEAPRVAQLLSHGAVKVQPLLRRLHQQLQG